MGKFKGIFYRNPNRLEPQVVGECKTKDEAIEALIKYADDNSLCSNLENCDMIKESLEMRDYYCFLNPWEMVVEEKV